MANPEVVSGVPGSFAWGVLHDRHPALIKQVRDGLPYPPDVIRALDGLAEEIEGVIRPLDVRAHDYQLWADWGRDYLGEMWYDVPFLWAESYFYRKLLDAVGYYAPGAWCFVDPFEPVKSAELRGEALADELSVLGGLPDDDRDAGLLTASLWGNQADLGFRLSQGDGGRASGLVVDQSDRLWSLLDDPGPERAGPRPANAKRSRSDLERAAGVWTERAAEAGSASERLSSAGREDAGYRPANAELQRGHVIVVADNSGRELVPDLLFADRLLGTGRAKRVVLHVKPYPYFTSDATMADVLACLRRIVGASGPVAEAGQRLWQALRAGDLVVRAHLFSCAPWSYHRMPADLADEFAAASLTIMKGDLNYRRLVGDQLWPADTPFETVTEYFPGPVAAVRTLKSDVVTGVPGDVLARLDAGDEPWRTSGAHALIQVRAG